MAALAGTVHFQAEAERPPTTADIWGTLRDLNALGQVGHLVGTTAIALLVFEDLSWSSWMMCSPAWYIASSNRREYKHLLSTQVLASLMSMPQAFQRLDCRSHLQNAVVEAFVRDGDLESAAFFTKTDPQRRKLFHGRVLPYGRIMKNADESGIRGQLWGERHEWDLSQ